MGRKWLILLCVFSMLTFLSSLVYNIFAFNNDKNKTELNSQTILASNNIYIKTNINYYSNNHLILHELFPSDTITKTFSITNNNSEDIIYQIEWNNVYSTWHINNADNTLIHPEEFIYSLKCTDGSLISNKEMPINNDNNIILDNLILKSKKTNTC